MKKILTIAFCCIILAANVLTCCNNRMRGKIVYMSRFLNNNNATENTKKLFDYLNISYGVKILSGQNIATTPNGEADIIYSVTGKYPAICSFDAAILSSLARKHSTQGTEVLMNAVLDWAKSGGIVAMQWHWFSPSGIHNNAE